VAFNNVNRTITGVQLCDQIKITNLLNLAGITSANRMVVKAVSVEAWMCKHNKDGKDGARNYVGSLLFDNNKTDKAKKTPLRKKTGEINVPLRGGIRGYLHCARGHGHRVEQVGHVAQRPHKTGSQEGRSRLG
jgi:hypothetical protein